MRYFSKLLAGVGVFTLLASMFHVHATIDFENVHQWLYIKGMTKFEARIDFRENDPITRGEAAKFIAQYAVVNNMGKTYTQCDFSDTSGYDYTLVPFIGEVCAYGLIKGSQGKFMPSGQLTEAQALAIVIRSLEGFKDETKSPWYIDYYTRGQELGLIEDETLASVQTTNITRGKLGTRLFLAYVSRNPSEGGDDTPVGFSMNVTTQTGESTDISNKINVEIEKQARITGYMNYDTDKVAQAVAQGQQVILFFNATWCPFCQALHDDLEMNNGNIPKDIAIFSIDYDTNMQLRTQYGVASQHTVIYLDKNGNALYTNVGKENKLVDIITVILTQNGTIDTSIPTI